MNGPLFHARAMRDHRFATAHASEFLDGELPVSGHRRVERHTEICPKCRELLRTLRRTVTAVQGLRAAARPGLADRVIARLHEERRGP